MKSFDRMLIMNFLMVILLNLILWREIAGNSDFQMSSSQISDEKGYERLSRDEELILKVRINGRSKIIKLKPTHQLLANEYLPVWISSAFLRERFKKLHDIVKDDVGGFTMYHDYTTKSALVYFHRRGELDGVIDIEYKIEALPLRELHKEHKISSRYSDFSRIKKFFWYLYRIKNKKVDIEKCQKSELKVYPELLIAISHDMFQEIEQETSFPYGVKTISHVLIVYNIVDMLYRFVKSADIFLNIAGIVIEGTHNDWGFITETNNSIYIDADKINPYVSDYFRDADFRIPRHAYDYVIYNTRIDILEEGEKENFGIAYPAETSPMFYPHNYPFRYNVAVRDSQSYWHYVIIAHELAHIFGAVHDVKQDWFFVPSCGRSIMTENHCPSRYCTKWRDEVERDFMIFFRSPAHCILRNKPRSLFPPGPRLMLTQLEQCKCYGFDSFHNSSDIKLESRCHEGIRCITNDGKSKRELPWPMDGSECAGNRRKVCWAGKCVAIQHEE